MPSGFVAPEFRCSAKNRSGQQCGNAGVVFTDPPFCRFHHGHHPKVLAKAAERARQYELGMIEPLDPPVVRRMKIKAWEDVQRRLARRAMKKAGILEDYDRTAIAREREDRQRRADLVRRLGTEAVAEQDEQTRRFNRWLRDGQRGPRPLLPGDEPADQPADQPGSHLADGGPEPATELARPLGRSTTTTRVPPSVATPERSATREGVAPHVGAPEAPSPSPSPMLERRGALARSRRPKRPTWPAGREPERLPGGGILYPDVLPVSAADAKRPGPEVVPYVGFDFDWEI